MYVIQNLNKFHWSIYREKDTGILIYFTIVIMIKLYKNYQVNKKNNKWNDKKYKALGYKFMFQ